MIKHSVSVEGLMTSYVNDIQPTAASQQNSMNG